MQRPFNRQGEQLGKDHLVGKGSSHVKTIQSAREQLHKDHSVGKVSSHEKTIQSERGPAMQRPFSRQGDQPCKDHLVGKGSSYAKIP